MAGQPCSRGALSRELSGIPVTKTHQPAQMLPTLVKCRHLHCAELAQEQKISSPPSQSFPELGPRLHGPCSCWQSAIGRIPQHPASCQRGHPKLPPVWHSARGVSESPPCMACCRGASESLCPWHCARWIRTWHTVLARGSMPGLISSINHCCVLQDVGPGSDLALL